MRQAFLYTFKCRIYFLIQWASLVAQRLKRLPPLQETWV